MEAVSEAIVVVDMVKDFVHGKLKTDRAQRATRTTGGAWSI